MSSSIELEYQVVGEGEPLVMIMGLGAQLVAWPEPLIRELAAQGFKVVVFDNRDVGLSTKVESEPVPNLRELFLRGMVGLPIRHTYTLLDMADDVAGLMNALGLTSAHVVGASMGGMIAQILAILHPTRVRTLTSVMSHSGRRRDSLSKPRALRALAGPVPKTPEDAMDSAVRFVQACGSKGLPVDWNRVRETARRAFLRSVYPRGYMNQLAAIAATPRRHDALRFLRLPACVIHGTDDPLIVPSGGRATARAIRGARLRMIEGMGHDLPPAVWPIVVEEVAHLAARVDEPTVTPIRAGTR